LQELELNYRNNLVSVRKNFSNKSWFSARHFKLILPQIHAVYLKGCWLEPSHCLFQNRGGEQVYDLPATSSCACHSLSESQAAPATPASSTEREDCNMSMHRDSTETPVCPEGEK